MMEVQSISIIPQTSIHRRNGRVSGPGDLDEAGFAMAEPGR
jgi:hypothetical protein